MQRIIRIIILSLLIMLVSGTLSLNASTKKSSNANSATITAVEQTKKMAMEGDAEAQFQLGRMYQKGIIKVELEKSDKVSSWVKLIRGIYTDPQVRAQNREGKKWLKKAAAQGHEQAAKWLENDKAWMGWTFLILGIIFLPVSIGLFKWPDVVEKYNPVVIRYLSAPLLFLFCICFLIMGFKAIFL